MDELKNLSSEQKYKAISNVLKEHYKQDLFGFLKNCLGYTEVTDRTHGEIVDALSRPSKRKLICVPRGCFKSSIASVGFPIWCLIKNPNLRVLIDSELYTNSKNFLREIKGHLQSDEFINIFGNWKTTTWNESEIIIEPRTKSYKEPSICVSGIGAEKTSQHYDIIIADDLNSASNSHTEEGRAKVIDHFRRYVSLLEPDGTIVVIGTRYATQDLIGWILETEQIKIEGVL